MKNNQRIGIVESEKTALIADLFFDEKITWMATGGIQGLTSEKLKPLKNNEVILFPDLTKEDSKNKAFELWKNKAKILGNQLNMNIKINLLLEEIADKKSREKQEDLADFILRIQQNENTGF